MWQLKARDAEAIITVSIPTLPERSSGSSVLPFVGELPPRGEAGFRRVQRKS